MMDMMIDRQLILRRETTLAVYGMAVVGMVSYTFTFNVELIAVTFVTAGAVG